MKSFSKLDEINMKLLSLNVGIPKDFEYQGKTVSTSIFKAAVDGKLNVSFLNIEGDRQADLEHHGGKDMAVYSYDIENYDHWKNEIERDNWEAGLFGENLTTTGLTDDKVKVGNIYEIGTVTIQAIQPRFPCFKLNIRFGRKDMVEKFFDMNRFGIYFRVIKEGSVTAGDNIRLAEESKYEITIKDVTFCKTSKGSDQNKLKQILDNPLLPVRVKDSVKMYLR